MSKFRAIFLDTLLEILNRKMIYFYGAVTLFLMALFLIVPTMTINGQDIIESGMIPPETVSVGIAMFFKSYIGFVFFLMVFGTAGLLPSFMDKGRIELTLSKPISRISLVSMKFLCVYLIMIAVLTVMTSVLWLVLSIRLGHMSGYFFYGLLFAWVEFLIVYAMVFTLGIFGRSTAMAIIGYFTVTTVAGLLSLREVVYEFINSKPIEYFLDTLYYILPKFGEMDGNIRSLMLGDGIIDMSPILSSFGFGVAIFLAGLLIFHRRDF